MTMLHETLAKLRRAIRLPACCPWKGRVTSASLRDDLTAGLTGAVIVLPQGVAFALIAGLPPEYGLYTAIVPTAMAALFGSSHHLVSGPTTAISVVVFTYLAALAQPFTPHYIQLALAMTFLAGLVQLGLGMAKMGGLINFVSQSVMTGFTVGAALFIALGQIGHLLGLQLPRQSFWRFGQAVWAKLPETNLTALAVGACAVAVAVLFRAWYPRLPALLLAMFAASGLGMLLGGDLAMVGALPSRLPPLSWPLVSPVELAGLVPGAVAVAMLGLAEAVAIARSVASRTGQMLDNNQEFIGQGLANIAGGFTSAYASSGSFTRTGVNLQAGGKTPVAGLVSAGAVAAILLLVAPLTAYLPMAAVAGVLLVVASGLIHVREIQRIMRTSRAESIIMGITALSCVLVDLEFALFSGVMLSLLFYLNRTAHPHFIVLAPDPSALRRPWVNVRRKGLAECPQIKILRLDGSIFFGAASNITEEMHRILAEEPAKKHILLVASGVNFIDVTGCQMVFQEETILAKEGRRLYLCSLKEEVLDTLRRCGCMGGLGKDVVFRKKPEALRGMLKNLDYGICACCEARVFTECGNLPQGYCALDRPE